MSNDLAKAQTVVDDNGTCRACGSCERIGVHHVTPLSEGGEDGRGNMVVLCRLCEKSVHCETPNPFGGPRELASRSRVFNIGLLREMTLVPRRYPRAFFLKHRMATKRDPSASGMWIGNAFDRFRESDKGFGVKWADGIEVAFRRCKKGDARLGADELGELPERAGPEGSAT